jgi:hypothetical protein
MARRTRRKIGWPGEAKALRGVRNPDRLQWPGRWTPCEWGLHLLSTLGRSRVIVPLFEMMFKCLPDMPPWPRIASRRPTYWFPFGSGTAHKKISIPWN